MVDINFYGHCFFKVKGKNASIIVDPFDPSVGLKFPKDVSSDIVSVTQSDATHDNSKSVKGEPVVISGPGEYEIKGIPVVGCETGSNTIYKFTVDKINFLHLGSLKEKIKFNSSSEFGDIDVLMIPVGASETLSEKDIEATIAEVEPLIVLPMNCENTKSLEDFVKKSGLNVEKVSSKLSLAKDKLPEQTTLYVFE